MNDYDAAAWAAHHGAWRRTVADAMRGILAAFQVLQRQRFAAPWRREGRRAS